MDAPPPPKLRGESDRESSRDKRKEPKEKSRHHNGKSKRAHRDKKQGDPSNANNEQLLEPMESISSSPSPPQQRWKRIEASVEKDPSGRALLPGEVVLTNYEKVTLFNTPVQQNPSSSLIVTNFRLYLSPPSSASNEANGPPKAIEIEPSTCVPLAAISLVKKSNKHDIVGLKLLCKDSRKLIFSLVSRGVRRDLYAQLRKLVYPDKPAFFASKFKYIAEGGAADDGWKVFDDVTEYTRLGLPNDQYRSTDINKKFAVCRSYPELLFVPKSISDQTLLAVAKFRSSQRLPVVTWLHPRSGATLTRCSQPLVGLLNHKSKEDAAYIAALIAAAPRSNGKLVLLDPRPSANASANKLRGGGVEDLNAYKGCTLEFGDIENIHVVRNNLTRVFKFARRLGRAGQQAPPPNFAAQYAETGWPQQIQAIMRQTNRMMELLTEGVPVLVHCSDGWDRTCQTIAIAELCLDHYYRTVRGLAVLIEKEWISFGHKFAQRHGFDKNIGKEKDEQRAPIFFQFLDCVYQLIVWYPTAFEFTAELLVALADHVLATLFGTFLANNLAERFDLKLPSTTASFWTYALHASDTHKAAFVNANFQPTSEPLQMKLGRTEEIKFFELYFMRWTAKNPPGYTYLLQTLE